jgi:hypothetical protein
MADQPIEQQSQQPNTREGQDPRPMLVAAPKDYFLGPVFAARKQAGAREITVGDRRYIIGGFHPMRPNATPPALDVRHARAIFSILSFRDPLSDSPHISFSLNELCRRYANSQGGRYSRDIKGILADLMDSYIRITDIKTNKSLVYRLIERVEIEDKTIKRKDSHLATSNQPEFWFHSCDLSPEFYDLLGCIVELQHLKLNVFTAIRSPLAQAIYLYIPSRAHHHTEQDPFEITLTNLLAQVSAEIPVHKSVRKRIFTQHENEGRSVLQQLDGTETLSGVFRVRLAETADGSDWKLQCWVEKNGTALPPRPPKEDSKLLRAFLKGGRTREDWTQMLTRITPLSGYEIDLLAAADVDAEKNGRFLEATRAILGETRFNGLLAEAKGDFLEKRKAKKNPAARLIHRLMEAISAPRKPAQKS